MQDLSALRKSVRQTLLLRPVDSPLPASESGESSRAGTPELYLQEDDIPFEDTISISEVLDLLSPQTSSLFVATQLRQTVILDTRPLSDFLDAHLPRSANVSIPSLIFKRFLKASGTRAISWDSLGSFVSTSAGKTIWGAVNTRERVNIVVVGQTAMDDTARVLRAIIDQVVHGDVEVLRGGWAAVISDLAAVDMLVSGEQSVRPSSSFSTSSSNTRSTAPATHVDGQTSNTAPRVLHHPSMPTLRPSGLHGKRNVPSLSLQTGASTSRRPPKLSLNMDRPVHSGTNGPFEDGVSPLNTTPAGPSKRTNPGLTISAPKSPLYGSGFQPSTQSRLPPGSTQPRNASGKLHPNDNSSPSEVVTPNTLWSSRTTARPDTPNHHPLPSPNAIPNGLATARNGMAPFIVSTILPSFLYLGPEITSREEVNALVQLGVKRILNVAIECDDDDELRMKERFERYLKVPMRDLVEESGVAEGMRDACKFLGEQRPILRDDHATDVQTTLDYTPHQHTCIARRGNHALSLLFSLISSTPMPGHSRRHTPTLQKGGKGFRQTSVSSPS